MVKLCKADYQRLHSTSRRIIGPDKNKEGQQMVRALYMNSKKRIPTKNEARDFYKEETKGHTYSITNFYEVVFGEVSPGKVVAQLESEIKTGTTELTSPNIETIMQTLSSTASSSTLTFHVSGSYDDFFNNPDKVLEVYRVSLD
jgi:hypothetical protein